MDVVEVPGFGAVDPQALHPHPRALLGCLPGDVLGAFDPAALHQVRAGVGPFDLGVLPVAQGEDDAVEVDGVVVGAVAAPRVGADHLEGPAVEVERVRPGPQVGGEGRGGAEVALPGAVEPRALDHLQLRGAVHVVEAEARLPARVEGVGLARVAARGAEIDPRGRLDVDVLDRRRRRRCRRVHARRCAGRTCRREGRHPGRRSRFRS